MDIGSPVSFFGAQFAGKDILLAAIPSNARPQCNTELLTKLPYEALYLFRNASIKDLKEKYPELDFRKMTIMSSLANLSNESTGITMMLKTGNPKERIYIPQNGIFSNGFEIHLKNCQ